MMPFNTDFPISVFKMSITAWLRACAYALSVLIPTLLRSTTDFLMSTRSTDPFNDMPEEGKKMKRNMITAPFYAVFQNGCVVELSIKPLFTLVKTA